MRASRGAAALALLLLPLIALPGCASRASRAMGWLGLGPRYGTGISRDELQAELLRLGNRFVVSLTAAADAITAKPTSREVNRRALLWKVRLVPLVQQASVQPDPQETFVSLLALAVSQRVYLTDGEGAALFDEYQDIAVVAAQRIEEDALEVGALFLSPAALKGVRWQVEEIARRNPIRGVFLLETVLNAYRTIEASGAFDWVFSIPLSPFRALEGVDAGAQAIREFNLTAQQFADLVARLPERARWESELLFYDLENRETMESLVASVAAIGASAERLSASAERLPADVRQEAERVLASFETQHGAVQKSLADARATLAELDVRLDKANELALQLDRVGVTWQGVVSTVRGPDDGREGRPFDVTEYERAAARIESASNAIRELVVEARAGGDAVSGLLDGLLWRLVALVAAFFGLRLAFRWLEARIGAPRA